MRLAAKIRMELELTDECITAVRGKVIRLWQIYPEPREERKVKEDAEAELNTLESRLTILLRELPEAEAWEDLIRKICEEVYEAKFQANGVKAPPGKEIP